MTGYVTNIEEESLSNKFFREVLFTGSHSQLSHALVAKARGLR